MTPISEHRINTHHRQRKAVVYVRQSSPGQVQANRESTRMQIGLREKAINLGFDNPIVIDEDLGVSAGEFSDRPGFRRLLAQVAIREVGLILCVDASRLSRNSKDWASLFQLCAHFDTLIADLDQVYDLSLPNDRLVLGIKGTVSEMELSIIKNRMKEGAEAKAARGELKFIVPPGYTHDPDDRIIIDPNRRIRHAINVMFDQFDRSSSIRQLALWYRDTATLFPVRKVRKTITIMWEIPSAGTLRKLLQHPIYAGVYTYGRRNEIIEFRQGKLVKRTEQYLDPDDCRVCIHDHHPAYISWDRFLANKAKITECRPRRTMQDNRGPVRDGLALLAGMLRCGHCGAKVMVNYKRHSALYYCDGQEQIQGERRCLSFGSKGIDLAASEELCRALSPLAIQAAFLAKEERHREWDQSMKSAHLQVQAAQYQADRAFEQFDLADPKNRLVVDALEERLNQKLRELKEARESLAAIQEREKPLSEEQRRRTESLANDFPALWNHHKADPSIKKRILRSAIQEVIVVHQPEHQNIEATIHWQGGLHTRIAVQKRATPIGSKAEPSLVETVRDLSALSDAEIARVLNMKKITTPRGFRWSKDRVCNFRKHHQITFKTKTGEEAYMTGQEAAERLGISRHGVMALIREGAMHNFQITDFAPWRIPRAEVESGEVMNLVGILKATGRLPKKLEENENQFSFLPLKSTAEKIK